MILCLILTNKYMFMVVISVYCSPPLKHRTPKTFLEIVIFGHPVSKSWLRLWVKQRVLILKRYMEQGSTLTRDLARIWIVGCPKCALEETGCPGNQTLSVRCGRSASDRPLRPGVWGPLKGPRSQRV